MVASMAIGGALAGWLLSFYGFEANVAQTAASANGIRLMFSVFPAIGTLIACTVMYFYPLTEKKMREIEEEIKVKKME